MSRRTLTSCETRYLSSTGSDLNDGLSPSTPWGTYQFAWDSYFKGCDLAGVDSLSGNAVTIISAPGYYPKGVAAYGPLLGALGPSSFVWTAAYGAPGLIPFIAPLVGNGPPFVAGNGARYTILNHEVDGSIASTNCLDIGDCAEIVISGPGAGFWFRNASRNPAAAGNHVNNVGRFLVASSYTVNGSAQAHIQTGAGGKTIYQTNGQSGLITVAFGPGVSFDAAFLDALDGGSVEAKAINWSGAPVLGKQWLARGNGVIDTAGGMGWLPGSIVGTSSSGGECY